eukprot:gene11909-4827_t
MSDRGDTKLMNPEWVSRMKCGPFISKGKKIVLYISITTTEHIEIDGIAEEDNMQSSAVLLAIALLESVGAVAFDPSLALDAPTDGRALLG